MRAGARVRLCRKFCVSTNKEVFVRIGRQGAIDSIEELFQRCQAVFLCLPTLFSEELHEYDKAALRSVCEAAKVSGSLFRAFKQLSKLLLLLQNAKFGGLVVVKSTVEPGTCDQLAEQVKTAAAVCPFVRSTI